MDNLLDRLIEQLDTLISFLDISHRDVFDLIQREHYVWYPETPKNLPDSYTVYRTQITHSALLLGYAYFEVFLSDIVRKIYQLNPKMLPNNKQLQFTEIVEAASYDAVINLMIDKEILSLFYQSMEKIIEYFEKKLHIVWPDDVKSRIIRASYIRNCIIHNNSIVDQRLASVSNYEVGQSIELSVSNVNDYGIMARNLARNLFQQANTRYFTKNASGQDFGQ